MTIRQENHEWFRKRLGEKLSGKRFPLNGTFELTRACNFHCKHCYLQGTQSAEKEMSCTAVTNILDQLAEAGCLGLSFTGGEPLLRPDFADILKHALGKGFLVAVFSNASLIDEKLADLLAANPPRCIEVTLYGGDEKSYQAITGSSRNFLRTLAGIDHLLKRGLKVVLKAVLLAPLVSQAEKMRKLASQRGLGLRFDPGIDPTLTGDQAPLALRPDPDIAIAIELADTERVDKLEKYDRQFSQKNVCDNDFSCGAGFSSFNIDPLGRLMPCLLLREPAVNIALSGFSSGWKQLAEARRPSYPADSACRQCDLTHLCGYCPGLARLGDSPPKDRSGYHCQVTQARANTLRQNSARKTA
ncbi:MAG: radical SAM protein [Deltaproteobacteria bacterium]|nr:radical SAM protein [Deltaproteobacteria bacterium]